VWVIADLSLVLPDKTGKPTTVGTLTDITDRKQMEEALRLTQFSLDHATDAVFWMDAEGRVVYANEAACRSLGRSCEEVLALSVPDINPRYREVPWATAWEVLKHRRTVVIEARHQAKDGHVFPVEVSIKYLEFGGRGLGFAFVRDISERKQIEEALRLTQFAVDHAVDAVYCNDAEGRIVYANEAACRSLGCTREELLALSISDIDPQFRGTSWATVWEVLKQRRSAVIETWHQTKDGRVFPVEVSGKYLEFGGNELSFSFVRDISARKRAEQALAEAEEKYRSLVLNLPDVVWTIDATQRYTFISPQIEKISGYTLAELEGQGAGLFVNTVHPDDEARVRAAMEALFTRGEKYDVECRARLKSGEYIWVHDRAVATYERDGVRYADGLLTDITERKRAEEALRESEDKFRELAENVQAVYWMMSPGGNKTLYISPAYEQIWGRSRESLYQNPMSWVEAIHPDDLEQACLASSKKMHGQALESVYRIRTPQGQEKWIRDRAFPVRDASGQLIRVVGLAEDFTERKQAEEEMRKAKEAAEAANQAKSQFLSNMSHELRTPMNGVLGMTGMLLETELTPEQARYAEAVHTSGEALLKLINQVLDFSEIEARKLTLEVEDFDLRMLLEQTVEILARAAGAKGLELTYLLSPGTPCLLRGDSARLRQVLLNLVGNAIKFTGQGEVNLRACGESEDQKTVTLRFAVQDTGVGIPRDRIKALFSPFVQADGSTTRRFGGTGLGLAIARQLVELMGGLIGVESEEGHGSTFWFTVVLEKQAKPMLSEAPSSCRD